MGLHRCEGPGVQGHHVRRGAGGAEHGQHHAGVHPGGHRRPRRDPWRHGDRHLRAGPRRPGRAGAPRHLVRRGRPGAGGRGRREVRDVLERPAEVHSGGARTPRPLGGLSCHPFPVPGRTRFVTRPTDGSRASRGRRVWSSSGSRAICRARN
ncbi:hypothetical protein SGPA1_31447 [Streptomyces misionensis JCM 4497]